MTDPRPSILCVDDDRDVVEVVQAILEDEGYAVSSLYDLTDDALLRTIGRLERMRSCSTALRPRALTRAGIWLPEFGTVRDRCRL